MHAGRGALVELGEGRELRARGRLGRRLGSEEVDKGKSKLGMAGRGNRGGTEGRGGMGRRTAGNGPTVQQGRRKRQAGGAERGS